MSNEKLILLLDERISFWNKDFASDLVQTRADAFIEAFELVKEWLEN